MGDLMARLKQQPIIAHILRTAARYNSRLGNQFGAGITYFSVLAMVPIALVAFSVLGFVLTVLRPDLLTAVQDFIVGQLGGVPEDLKAQLATLIESTLGNWRGTAITGLLSAVYAGAGWMGNLKSAVRAQYRPEFDLTENKRMIVVETLINLLLLFGLLILVAITFGLATVATSAGSLITQLLNLQSQPLVAGLVTKLAPIVGSLIAGWLVFVYLYTVLPEKRAPFRAVAKGALIGAVALGALQYLSTFLVSAFSKNAAASIFGPVILLMLFFNLFARLILYLAAWIATATQQALPNEWQDIDEPLLDDPNVDITKPADADDPAGSDKPGSDKPGSDKPGLDKSRPDSAAAAWGRRRGTFVGPTRLEHSEPDPNQPVPQDVAARGVRLGMGAGWITGAATGIGVGAVITTLLTRLVRRK